MEHESAITETYILILNNVDITTGALGHQAEELTVKSTG